MKLCGLAQIWPKNLDYCCQYIASTLQSRMHARLTFRHEQNIIKQVVSVGCGLPQRNKHGSLAQMTKVTQGAGDLASGAAIKTCADLI